MLSAEKNRLLTQVGPGTPMGDLLRRYWMPIGGASEFEAVRIKPIRLLGEDLVLYRDLGGRFGLLDRHCPHRRADLSYGLVEECGLRCNYHGWLMDESGRCIERPYDDTISPRNRGKERRMTTAYPVKEAAGLLWAYMGPPPVPELPVWEPFTWENGFREIVLSDIPCNWFQCQENSCDPVHFEWMHENWNARLHGDTASYSAKHLKLKFEEFNYGFIYRRVREGQREGDPVWTVGRVTLWPNGFYLGNHFEWRVPIDDENTLSICWFFMRVPKGREPYRQDTVPTWVSPIFDDLDAIAQGREPKAVIRNPNVARCVELPNITKKTSVEGLTLEEHENYPLLKARLKGFRHCFGQPPEVRRAFEEAMGIAGS